MVLINNIALDALIVLCVLYARRRRVRRVRVTAAVATGAAVAVAYGIAPDWARIPIRVLLAPVMTALSDRYGGIKDYLASLALLCLFTFALGGCVEGAAYLTGTDPRGYPLIGFIAAAAVAMVVALRAIMRAGGRLRRKTCSVKLAAGGTDIDVRAFCDSGNSLTDTVSGLPVIIVSEKLAGEVEGWHGTARASHIEGFVSLSTVSGEASLPIVRVDVTVNGRRCRAYAALSEKNFDGYEVILQNTMF